MCKRAKTFISIFFIVMCFALSSCDNITDFLESFSTSEEATEEITEESLISYEKDLLLEILADMERQLEEAQYSKSIGDKDAIRSTYEEIIRLEQSYQDEFEKYENELSQKDLLEISGKHQKIVRNIPKFGDLMN